jgi:hypothetical protein
MKSTRLTMIVIAVMAVQGCAYLGDRARDAGDMLDLGVTLSLKPSFAVYGCALGLAGLGYGSIDGKALGLFGGRVGLQSLNTKVWAAGPVGGEDLQLGDEAPVRKCTGAVCIVRETPQGKVKSTSCCHYLHLGFVGLAGNLHFKEIADFFGGIFGADISKDDGVTTYAPTYKLVEGTDLEHLLYAGAASP